MGGGALKGRRGRGCVLGGDRVKKGDASEGKKTDKDKACVVS